MRAKIVMKKGEWYWQLIHGIRVLAMSFKGFDSEDAAIKDLRFIVGRSRQKDIPLSNYDGEIASDVCAYGD